jgi:hypothetical protein
MELLRSDIEFLVALARADTGSHLVHWYSELGFEQAEQAWTHDPERTGPIGPLATGVEWSWVGVHDDEVSGATSTGSGASGRDATARGVSLMGVEDAELRLCGGPIGRSSCGRRR